jgi:hypothetical protein
VEVLSVGIPSPHKCMVVVHAECNVLHLAIEQLLWNAQPLSCVEQPVVPFGEHHVVEGDVLRVRP